MAWVRIEDAVTEHRKHLKAGPAACWLWVCGLAYCQRQLSDGFIPVEAIGMLGVVKGFKPLIDRLVEVGLFDVVPGGYAVHDYHDFNDTRDEALARQHSAREQRRRAGLASGRSRRVERTVNGPVERPLNPIPSHPIPSLKEKEVRPAAMRSKRPIFTGQRLTVFEWMLDELMRTLGVHTDAFGLDEWFYTADAIAVKEGAIVADWWPWLQSQTLMEAKRRGLQIAGTRVVVPAPTEKVRGCRHTPQCVDAAAHTKRDLQERRAS